MVVASLGYNMGLKTIKFDDMNWDEGYGANTAYSQSKLGADDVCIRTAGPAGRCGAQRCRGLSSAIPAHRRHHLITTSGSRTMRFIWWLMTKTPMVQTAEQGSYPEVMCATEEALTEQRALYGPTGRMEAVGPVGKGTLNAHAYDKAVMTRLWQFSENAVGFDWKL